MQWQDGAGQFAGEVLLQWAVGEGEGPTPLQNPVPLDQPGRG